MTVQLGPVPGTNEQSQARQNVAIQQLFAFLAGGDASLTALGIGYGKFTVDRNGSAQGSLSATADNKIAFNHEVFDPDSVFDATTNFRYQPLKPGYYTIGLSVEGTGAGSTGDSVQAWIYLNGSRHGGGNYAAVSITTFDSVACDLINLNGTTDYVEGFAYIPAGITSISGNIVRTRMFGYRVSP